VQALSSGTLRYTRDIISGLSKLGVRLVVASLDTDYGLQGVKKSHRLGSRLEWLGQRLAGRLILEFIHLPVVLPRLVRVVVGERIDVLYAQNMDETAFISCLVGAITRRQVILFVHDLTDRELYVYDRGFRASVVPFLYSLARWRHKIVGLFSTHIFVASRFIQSEIGVHSRRPVIVIPHGVVTRSGRSPEKGRSGPLGIVCIGKLERKKRFEVPISAIALLSDVDVRLTIVGSGPGREELLDVSRSLGVANRVNLAGFLDDEALQNALRESDLGVVSSLWEGFGYAALEMMGSGLPVIASNAGALPEVVVQGLNGYLFERDDYVQLASIIRRLCTDRNELERLRRGAIETAMKFSLERMVDATYRNIRKILESGA
jgi:glycosyltransferase involved in cell wall biosynthesis